VVVPAPHLLFVHVWPLGQVPHDSVPPQPSETFPQVAPAAAHVFGVHPPLQAATGFCTGVGQSLYWKPAAFVKVAANCAQPLSHVLVQQYAWAASAHTSWTQYPLALPEAGMHPPDAVLPPLSGPPEHVSSCAHVVSACSTDAVCSNSGDRVLHPTTTNATTAAQRPAVTLHVLIASVLARAAGGEWFLCVSKAEGRRRPH
jgi:hypothetical protein